MKKRIISIIVCLLFIGMIPIAMGINYDTDGAKKAETPLSVIRIFGLFPQVSDNDITYVSLLPPFPLLSERTIRESHFDGHIGIVFIIGWYDTNPFL